MTAEIVSVGTELLLGQIVDTHAPVMARMLAECGIACTRRSTVGDNWDRLVAELRGAFERADVVITIGGLGPTADDMTRDAIAAAMDDEMEHVPEVEEALRAFFASRNVAWTESIARQADKPKCARLIENPNGTAPGLICEKGGKVAIALPGPKGEFGPMAKGPVKDFLERLQGGGVIHSRVLRVIGMGESMVEDKLKALMEGENPTVAPYAKTGEVHLRLTARAATRDEANAMLNPVEEEIRSILGNHVYGVDDTTLEMSVIELLRQKGARVAVAESMTGGELSARLSVSPGSSSVFVGGSIVYSVLAKEAALDIDRHLLEEAGPVSREVAEALAVSTRMKFESTYGIAITGNAGPTSDVDGKPVGLVYISLAGPGKVETFEHKYRGQREDIRRRATQQALSLLRDTLL